MTAYEISPWHQKQWILSLPSISTALPLGRRDIARRPETVRHVVVHHFSFRSNFILRAPFQNEEPCRLLSTNYILQDVSTNETIKTRLAQEMQNETVYIYFMNCIMDINSFSVKVQLTFYSTYSGTITYTQ